MLHKIDDNATPTATSATTTADTTTTTATTIIMAPTETTGNGTEPIISTHLTNAAATIEPTTAAATTTTAAATASNATTEQETIAAAASTCAAVAELATTAAEGHATAITTTTLTANNTKDAAMLPTTTLTPTPLPLSAVAEMPELTKTADVSAVAVGFAAANDVAADAAAATALRVESNAAFDVQMRTQQQQKIKIYHGAKQSAVWRTDSLASNSSSNRSDAGSTETIVVARSSVGGGCSTAPSLLQRKFSDGSFTGAAAMPRRVSFPESDRELVTGYLEPANPWEQGKTIIKVLL